MAVCQAAHDDCNARSRYLLGKITSVAAGLLCGQLRRVAKEARAWGQAWLARPTASQHPTGTRGGLDRRQILDELCKWRGGLRGSTAGLDR